MSPTDVKRRLLTNTAVAYGTTVFAYAVGFVARPLGAALFGHFGDRVGRKALLITTMMLMGVATMAVGLVPSYAAIGPASAVLLTLFRAVQGLAVGGEWSGSVLIAGEWAPANRRGFFTSWPQAGAPLGLMAANLSLSGMGGRTDVLINHVWCRPCMLRECPLDHRCMNGLSPARVTKALTDLMTNRESRIPNPESRIPRHE